MKKILVVDDQLAMRNMFKKILTSDKFQIELAEDGALAYRAAQLVDYDMVITDYYMPHLNGIELTDKLRALRAYIGIPILIVSTAKNTKFKEEAKGAGATGWFSKPIKQDELLPTVLQLLNLR
ncbi:response regulator [Shewanella woodyi]|uniref:Response regulator receiver protein n=1 Tax=Shewanella woodyi (strain ATCC 51908 / MS32) TaxID=392500 RepID=B1KLM5_SHEWM|nr:response regulator [Shewanella woodyi]ACA87322.1 response regulator receiver protein [Shewanella woodyi ATCC 51908]